MKWLLTITMAVMLCGCSSSSAEASQLAKDGVTESVETQQSVTPIDILNRPEQTNMFREDALRIENRKNLNAVVIKLLHRVGKTPYVPTGSSLYGWDCSGMVRWAYEQLGKELPHSATKQAYAGHRVKTPKVGDIVVFGWKGSKYYDHSAIYIGKGKVVNANQGFGGTYIELLTDYKKRYSKISYVEILDTP